MAVLAPEPKAQFFAADGTPLVGGKVYTYAAGTSTPLATFTNANALTPNTNPVILDARGECNLWFSTGTSYKVILHDADDNLIWSVDNIATYGTLSSQNFNNVNITGGAISGITATFDVTGNLNGNASTVTNGVYLNAIQTLTNKTMTGIDTASTINDPISGTHVIGYRKIPQSLNTTAAASDVGKHLYVSATTTIPSGVFVTGDAFFIINSSGSSVTVTQGAGTTLRLAGSSSTGNRTLPAYGMARVICVGSETFYINGVT